MKKNESDEPAFLLLLCPTVPKSKWSVEVDVLYSSWVDLVERSTVNSLIR